jgi:hypothetical protein
MTKGQKIAVAVVGVGLTAGVVALIVARRRSGSTVGSSGPTKDDRIGALQDAVFEGVKDPQLRELALAITGYQTRQVDVGRKHFSVRGAACRPRDERCEADSVARWVAQHGEEVDLFRSMPDRLAALTCVLVSENGVTCRFRSVTTPDGQRRVYPIAGSSSKENPARWSAVDSSLGPAYSYARELPYKTKTDYDG